MQGIQLGLIAKLGQQALCATDLNALLASAVAAVIEGLAADCCRVLRIGAAGQPAVVESGAGWDEDRLDHEWVESVAGTRIGHLIEHGEPLLVETHPSGCRFAPDEVLAAHGIRSGLELLIGGPGAPWGILGAYARQPRLYSPECVNFLHGIANILGFAFERTKAAEKLAFLVEYDALTGLPNRDVFRERLAHTIAGAERAGQMVGILYIDLEGFKGVNDSRGRDTGDRLMGLVAERLQSCVAGSGVVGRVGGDEFAIAISDLADSDDVDLMAEIVVEQLAQPFDLDGQEALIVASIGIAMFPLDGTAADVLLRNAEFAMHQGREQSRGSFQNRMIDLDGDL